MGFGGDVDTSGEGQQIAFEKQERADKLQSLERQRFDIIKSQGNPVWNSLAESPTKPGQE